MPRPIVLALCVAVLAGCRTAPPVPPAPPALPPLTADSASNFALITLRCVAKAYPSQPGYVLNAPEDVQLPGHAEHRRAAAARRGARAFLDDAAHTHAVDALSTWPRATARANTGWRRSPPSS